jgi:pimeloyl-ACP methyl ester carboxylesterase
MLKITSERLPGRLVTMPGGTVARYCEVFPNIARRIPSVLLLHGGNLSLESWEPWRPHLGEAARLIAVDLAAHGLTGSTLELFFFRHASFRRLVYLLLGA